VLIAGIIRGFKGVVCLSYLLPVLSQPLKIVLATLVVSNAIPTILTSLQLSGATEVALLLTRPNFKDPEQTTMHCARLLLF